ncbi:tRNA (adenosine(37)-N6)-threonylcarbamoyltransferase complex dimerization subunit type 1 TsaB [Flavihumibacter profundi]|uniref:tRNA (adenosine(37)-N6)-threonylcarbamoyltransferase complex dimerization subunit type 1 TsaB n=1 Tax=Flavihumibacter profundi TaxID=2716883 RepID=UPI001CC8254E|nr:tRNA (adenosine(37)-N6)-threonylcarbamoyltransferase complex dimerization subunit type 1 TsaB [Flavihumibacter profundi]MBZ5857936.1 tRNA (adenosine(37)-N6)-threonylcarbamoyltransferase complex dimerization subunit type 1 TsaB [Flavihumibacter profundi]
MARILIIDTAVDIGGICLCEGPEPIAEMRNDTQKEQAGWLQPAIAKLLKSEGTRLEELDAIAVSAGPGSYTGLRVSMATAKGLCYALSKPLIAMNTLRIMAISAKKQLQGELMYCPMIDARRMEVFSSLFDNQLVEILPPQALVLETNSFDHWLALGPICFFGNGAEKYKNLLKNDLAIFKKLPACVADGAVLAAEMYAKKEFSDLAYAEPFYVKAFYSHLSVNS